MGFVICALLIDRRHMGLSYALYQLIGGAWALSYAPYQLIGGTWACHMRPIN